MVYSALETSARVRSGELTAVNAVSQALQRIDKLDKHINAFTLVLRERALREASALDAARAKGATLGALAGAPFAVKNLFDIEGEVTLAGSRINRDNAPAAADATLIRRLRQAGAVLVGALNMDEYAYGFTTENSHYGATHNPHDITRIAGGSSGGSAAAVAAGMAPFTLGSDTNGSIRVPASLCGVFGLKPTYGRLTRSGSYLFAASFDHLGAFARNTADLATVYDLMQGPDASDFACAQRQIEATAPLLHAGAQGLRIAIAGGYFEEHADADALDAVQRAAAALGASKRVTVPEAARARAAAFIITAIEGANLHRDNLLKRAQDFDPLTRERFFAGLIAPASWYLQAQRFRAWYRRETLKLFADVDVIIAPSTPVTATRIGQDTLTLNGIELALRPSLGLLTQPLSFIGLPITSAPVVRAHAMPIGVQIIAAPWREDLSLRVAAALEQLGVVAAPVAKALS